ncbi:MAG TPA: hypothetical protein VLA62_06025 [Solirubrobacterales bacterium]|nr:hypothetical protein [Solirubrobacterales bacterium]
MPRYVQEQLQRRAQLGEVRVNPLLFKLEIKDFRLQEADGRPLLGFDRSARSVSGRTWPGSST